MGGRGPRLPDLNTLMALGLLPRDGILPNDEVKKILRVNDEQIHINRGKWYNFPRGLNGNLVERIIYYRGQGMLCYIRGMERFVFLPFCLNQGLDIYGRYTHGTPIPFNGSAEVVKLEDLKKSKDAMTQILSDLKYQLLYDPVDLDEIAANPDMLFECAVVLSDYTRQLPQTIIPKYKLTEQIINYESMIIPYVNTALMSATGIGGMRVNGQEEQQNVELASRQVQYASLTGMKWLPIDGPVEFQELTGGQVAKAEEFLLVMQSMENYRLGIHGVANGGLFEKKAHTTDFENSINMGTSSFTIRDATWNRQQFCTIANSLFGTEIWYEPDEITLNADTNMDGVIGDGAEGENMVDAGTGGGTSNAE